jgi:signal transduction histidine kinase
MSASGTAAASSSPAKAEPRRWSPSLRARLIVGASIVVTVVIGLQSYLEIRLFERHAESDLRETGVLTAQAVSDDLELRGGLQGISETTASLHNFITTVPSIRSITVVAIDPTGRPIVPASTSSDERAEAIALGEDIIRGAPPEWHNIAGTLMVYGLPVMRGDTPEAAVVVTMSRAAVRELRTRGRLVTFWLAPAAIVLLTLLIDLLARQMVYRPLATIRHTMERAGGGEQGIRAPVLRHDELGAVAVGLNEMLDRLEGFSASLQDRVAEATSELRASNAARIESYDRILALREALARSEQLAAVGQTAASVAHQVGTPLNLVSGYVQMLVAEPGLDSQVLRRLQIVQDQIGKVADVVRGLLNRARPATEEQSIDVRDLLDRVRSIATPRFEASGVRLVVEAEPGVPGLVGNGTDLELAILNLVTNAVDAMPGGGDVRIGARAVADRVRLTVTDTGHGIPPEVLPRIFDPWFTTKPVGRGSGLGLGIVRDVVARFGGTIDIASAPGAGTTVTMDIPWGAKARG